MKKLDSEFIGRLKKFNRFFELLPHLPLNQYETKILLVIGRDTVGWFQEDRLFTRIPNAEFRIRTGIKDGTNILRGLRTLLAKKIILKRLKNNLPEYGINPKVIHIPLSIQTGGGVSLQTGEGVSLQTGEGVSTQTPIYKEERMIERMIERIDSDIKNFTLKSTFAQFSPTNLEAIKYELSKSSGYPLGSEALEVALRELLSKVSKVRPAGGMKNLSAYAVTAAKNWGKEFKKSGRSSHENVHTSINR